MTERTARERLLAQLEGFSPADALEREHQRRLLQLVRETAAPFSAAQYAPGHVTASAFILNDARDELLLIFHGKLARWLQPGGHVEPADIDALAAARREVREEVGLEALSLAHDGIFDVDVHAIPARRDQPAHEHFDVRFLLSAHGASTVSSQDLHASRWVPVADLLAMETASADLPTDESVLRAVRKIARGRS